MGEKKENQCHYHMNFDYSEYMLMRDHQNPLAHILKDQLIKQLIILKDQLVLLL